MHLSIRGGAHLLDTAAIDLSVSPPAERGEGRGEGRKHIGGRVIGTKPVQPSRSAQLISGATDCQFSMQPTESWQDRIINLNVAGHGTPGPCDVCDLEVVGRPNMNDFVIQESSYRRPPAAVSGLSQTHLGAKTLALSFPEAVAL